MSNMAFLDKLSQDSINALIEENTTRSTAEAIAIAISHLKDKDGKLVRTYLSDDYDQHLEFCIQIAKQLRNEK